MGEHSEEELVTRLETLSEEYTQLLEEGRKRFKRFEEQWGDAEKVPAFAQLKERLDEQIKDLETRLNRGPINGGNEGAEERAAFAKWARGAATPEDMRSLVTDDDKEGGLMVPKPVVQAMLEQLKEISPIRQNASTLTISTGDAIEIPEETGDFGAGWVGERDARPATATSHFKPHRISLREQYANPAASQKMLSDSGFDVEGYISRKLAERFNELENTAFLFGDNVLQPEGIMTDAGITRVNTGAANALDADGVLDLVYEIPTKYSNGVKLYLNRKMIRQLRKLKDANGQYLWQPNVQQGQPSTFAGVSLIETPDLPDTVADGDEVMLAGNLKTAYQIVDKTAVGMLRDPYTNKPFVQFYTTRRVGGAVTRPDALAIQEVGA